MLSLNSITNNNINNNFIVNGNFDIWQEGTNFTSLPNRSYVADVWLLASDDDSSTYDASLDSSSNVNTLKVKTTLNLANKWGIHTLLENITRFEQNSYYTLSFDFKADKNLTFESRIQAYYKENNAVENWLESTTSDVIPYNTSYGTKRYSITLKIPNWSYNDISMDQLNNTALVVVPVQTDSDATINISKVKFEIGKNNTPFIPKSTINEFNDCSRYIYKFECGLEAFARYADEALSYFVHFNVDMRNIPTITENTYVASSNVKTCALNDFINVHGFWYKLISLNENVGTYRISVLKADSRF